MISAFNEVLSSLENKKVIEALEEAHRIERVRQHKARRRKLIIERWQSEEADFLERIKIEALEEFTEQEKDFLSNQIDAMFHFVCGHFALYAHSRDRD